MARELTLKLLQKMIAPIIPSAKALEPAPEKSLTCPKCGREMVLRIAKNGTNHGEQFWGCPGYPNCRGILKKE